MNNRPKVYVPNKSYHDFSQAERFGTLVFLTEGTVKRLAVSQLFREISEKMKDAEPDDYLLVSSLSILNVIIASIMTQRFQKLNLLLWKDDKYIVRHIGLEGV